MSFIQNFLSQFVNNTENANHRSIIKWLWRFVFIGIASVFLLFIILSFSDLPSVKQLENPRSEEASLIFGNNNTVFGRYYIENRVPIEFDQLDKDLVSALIATEDERFYEHSGIDFKALFRAIIKTGLLGDSSAGGASTITQQLAKLLFTGKPASGFDRIMQKFKEWIIAVRLERRYTKEEIIAMYLNKFDFLFQSYGIKAAAETYFNTSQDSLAVEQAALLVGMLKNPDRFNPVKYPERAKQRRSVVLNQMKKNKYLTQEQYDQLKDIPLGIEFTRKTHIDGIATYFRMELAKDVKKILDRPECLKSDGTKYNIYRDGLRIYTTIDPDMQEVAEQEMLKHMSQLQKTFNNHWTKSLRSDPWKYQSWKEEDREKSFSVEYRTETLKRLIRETGRYQGMRDKYIGSIVSQLKNAYPELTFHSDDREIYRMMQARNDRNAINNMVAQRVISRNDAQLYRKVMKNSKFQTLIEDWGKFQRAVDESFNREVKMKVFAYNNRLETDTTMTPLDSIKYHRNFLQTGIVGMDPLNGQVRFWVGGINHKYFQYDHVRTNRQVGSTFKPFIYATAIALQGISPCFKVPDVPQTIAPGDGSFYLGEPWTPDNFNGKFTGEMYTLRRGLAKSKNTVSVYLMKQLGDTDPVRGLVHNMGIDSSARYANGIFRVPKAPSICLGVSDLTVYEMASAYSTFANNGIHAMPATIMRIEDKNGRVIFQNIRQDKRALPENANYVMVDMLRSAAAGLGAKSDYGGKTGTTNEFVDGWFIGITPQLVVGTWVGGEDRWIRFHYPSLGQGSRMAKPFFASFLKNIEKNPNINFDPKKRFYRPSGSLGIELDCSKYEYDGIGPNLDSLEENQFTENQFGDELVPEFDPNGNQ